MASTVLRSIAFLPCILAFRHRSAMKAALSNGACVDEVSLISEARDLTFGSEVKVRAVVTAVLPGLSGYYIQEAFGGDDDPATSDGIFVFDTSASVEQGQLLGMTAITSSYSNNMQLNPLSVEICGTSPLPAPVALDQLPQRAEAAGVWASLQGMLITVSGPVAVTAINNLQRYAEIGLSTGDRLMIPSQVVDPNSSPDEHDALLESYRDTLVLSAGSSAQNPDPIPFPGEGLSQENVIRVGDSFLNVTGPLGYRFRKWIVDKTPGLPAPVHIAQNPRPEVPQVGGRLTISAFNVLNYFNGPPAGLAFGAGRGADSELEFERQRAKIISAMVSINASIFALNEVENNGIGPDSAVQNLLNGLNAALGADSYTAVDGLPATIGGDKICSRLIYRPSQVKVVGAPAILDSSVDPDFQDYGNRPSIAATFEEMSSPSSQVTVVVNHLRSKGSSCEYLGDPDDTRSGNCNGVRTNASRAIGRWMQRNPTGISTEDILLIGDMNSYAMESPIQALVRDFGYTDTIDHFGSKTEAYSYVYGGHSGYLDHALASPHLLGRMVDAKDWHINADESAAFEYTTSYKTSRQVDEYYSPDPYRCSDHDALIVGLN